MKEPSSSTADATSDLNQRISEAITQSEKILDASSVKKIREVQDQIDDLRSRGFLRKQEFKSMGTSEFERLYMA